MCQISQNYVFFLPTEIQIFLHIQAIRQAPWQFIEVHGWKCIIYAVKIINTFQPFQLP